MNMTYLHHIKSTDCTILNFNQRKLGLIKLYMNINMLKKYFYVQRYMVINKSIQTFSYFSFKNKIIQNL
jgi:hypothetical protein